VDQSHPWTTAQQVALVRSYLHRAGVIDDPWAAGMLRTPWDKAKRLLRLPAAARLGRNRSFAYLAARTLYFDEAVNTHLDRGARQVLVVGSGYDSRAWRLARPDVRYFEMDHPATQADKRKRAPDPGPTYLPVDIGSDDLELVVRASGWRTTTSGTICVEGLTMYLPELEVRRLLTSLARLCGEGSRLIVNLGVGFESSASSRSSGSALIGRVALAVGRSGAASTPGRHRPSSESAGGTSTSWSPDRSWEPATCQGPACP
jgi:methyltransferase (TIGR00027 family)